MGAKTKEKKAKEKPTSANDAVPPLPQPPPLFGGWTGKTPVTLLNEYIQRQQSEGWHRADYSVHGGPSAGYLCIIRLTKQDKKLGQLRVEFKPTATATTGLRFPTAIEARHMAATYTLFRLRANTSLYRMIPPVHRAYWLDLDAIKKEESSAKEWMYAEDPFAAQVARDRDRVDRDRARAQVAETRVRAKETGRHEDLLPGGLRRRWDDLAEVAMSEAQRSAAESVVRTWTATWKLPVSSSDDAGAGAGADKSGGRMGLVKRGFRATHVDEALAACQGDPGRAFEWLCVHVPEDDLPAQVMRRGYHASLVVGSNNSTDTVDELALQLAARRLARSGFALSLCRQALDQAMVMPIGVAESRAAEILVSKLCQQPVPELTAPTSGELDAVEEEIEALLAIYAGEDRVSRPSPYQVSVSIRPNDCCQLCSADACLEFWIPVDSSYPELRPPAVTLSSDSLPAYLKLHVAKTINRKLARDGMPVLFDAVSMADECIEQWLANPPPLADLMQGMSSSELTEAAPEQSQGDIVATKRKKGAFNKTNRGPIVDDSRRKEWVQAMDAFTRIQGDPAYRRMQQTRAQLPAASVASALVALVGSNRCVVVSGATGCGKTTQVPQFILDAGLRHDTPTNIVCTQPRRISAIGVASRVADERASSLGDAIGYAVRGESRRSPGTRLLFCTTGVLLRMIASDPSLADVTHVICDEVHERSVDSDLLLVLLLQTLRLNQTIRLVLMSATAQSDVFAEYFGSGSPVVDIPGRTFPVDDVYIEDFASGKSEADLAPVFGGGSACWAQQARRRWEQMESDEGWMARAKEVKGDRATVAALLSWEDRFAHAQAVDYTLAAAIVRHIHETTDRGLAVLIFMPGVAEIQATIAALKDIDGVFVLPLHAGLSASEQRRVFAKPSKQEQGRKVVVATNIAETSITIDDIGFVVDSGRVRELRHDHQTRVARLTTVLCSQAAAAQRRGRAGRTQPGVCFRMYTRAIHERMPLHADPEILRSPLEQVCLRVKALGHDDPRSILQSALDPPSSLAIASAEQLLVAIGACTAEYRPLTALGRFIADIPVDLRLAKILVYGAMMGVLDDALKIVALMALDKPLFSSGGGDRDAVKQARLRFASDSKRDGLSDWLADLAAYNSLADTRGGGGGGGAKACYDACVSPAAIRDVKTNVRQLRDSIRHTGLVEPQLEGTAAAAASPMVLKALICAGLVPNIVRVRMPKQKFTEVIGGTVSKDHEAREMSFYAPDLLLLTPPPSPPPPSSGNTLLSWQSYDYRTDRRVFVHPQSTLFAATKYQSSPFIVYFAQSSMSKDRTYLRDVTVPGLYALLMFGPAPLIVDHENKVVCIGSSGALAVRAWPRIAVLVNHLRILLDELLRRKLESPQDIKLAKHPVVQTVLQLIQTDGQ